MPRQNARKDSITIYYAYRLGINEDGIERFGNTKSVLAYADDRSGTAPDSVFGTDNNYSLQLLIPVTEATRYFDKYTKIWVRSTPKSSDDQADYKIQAEPLERDGQIYVQLQSIAVDHRDLYYLYNGEIITFSAIWNDEQHKFYTPTNMYLPIDKKTKMWYEQPENEDDENGRLTFKSKRTLRRYIEYTVNIKE